MRLEVLCIAHEGVTAKLPEKATEGSAGFDLAAALSTPVEVMPGQIVTIPTGVAIGLPDGEYAALVFARSGLAAKHGISLTNGVGLIDSDYTGEIKVSLCNISDTSYTIRPGERIAQLVIAPMPLVEIVEVEALKSTERADGGFGSTGKY